MLSNEVYCNSNVLQTGVWAIFRNFFGKKAILLHWITLRTYLEPFESTRFLTFESQLKKLSCSVLLLLAIYVQKNV